MVTPARSRLRAPSARALAVTVTAIALLVRCDDCGPRASRDAAPAALFERVPLPGDALRGLSGLTPAPAGSPFAFLAVAERLHHLIPVVVDGSGLRSLPPIPVEGVDPDLDLEGLAFMDASTLVFATEADRERRSEKILFAHYAPDRVQVFRAIEFDYEPWGLLPTRNRGLEGICIAGDALVVASEMVAETDGRRWSPAGVYDLHREDWTPYRVFLSSDTGKLSGLVCRVPPGAPRGPVEVTAIERHFDLLHVVRFTLDPSQTEVEARLVADLRPGFSETPPNFEGLGQHSPGVYFLITDNDWHGVRGPTEMIRWEEPALEASVRP
jgi:hypothetical protein